jgi:hypothetical protein
VLESQIGLNGEMSLPISTKLMYSRIKNGNRKNTTSQVKGKPITKRRPGILNVGKLMMAS